MDILEHNKYQRKYLKYKTKYYRLLKKNNREIINYYKLDTNKILYIADQVKILGMSDITHGQNNITKFRIHIFKILVKKYGYTVFVLEDQYSCCELINQYVKTGSGDIRKIMSELMWFWKCYDLLKLIKWMRKYNAQNGNILEFKGIDIQSLCEDDNDNNDYNNAEIDDPIAFFVKKKFRKDNKIDKTDWIKYYSYRDKAMFEVFNQIYDPTKKYFIYAHNTHLAKLDYLEEHQPFKLLGTYLSEKYNRNYYIIGNVFFSGKYIEVEPDDNTKTIKLMTEIPVIPILKSKNINEGLNVYRWPYENLAIWDGYYRPKIENIFDALMVIGHESPLRLIDIE